MLLSTGVFILYLLEERRLKREIEGKGIGNDILETSSRSESGGLDHFLGLSCPCHCISTHCHPLRCVRTSDSVFLKRSSLLTLEFPPKLLTLIPQVLM